MNENENGNENIVNRDWSHSIKFENNLSEMIRDWNDIFVDWTRTLNKSMNQSRNNWLNRVA
jgi:hypothetical protein